MSRHVRISELARAYHSRGSALRIMALLRAHFDASFTEPEGVTSIGGYVGTEAQWVAVEVAWAAALDMWGLDEFHLAPLLHGETVLGRAKGEMAALWFARILGESGLHSVGASFRDIDWSPERRTADAAWYPEPYHACLDMVLGSLAEHMRFEFPDDAVVVLVDSDTLEQAAAEAIFERKQALTKGQFVSFGFSSRARCRSLQCADLYAGAERRMWLEAQSWQMPEMPRLYAIAQGVKGRGSYWSLETEKRIAEILAERASYLEKERKRLGGEGEG